MQFAPSRIRGFDTYLLARHVVPQPDAPDYRSRSDIHTIGVQIEIHEPRAKETRLAEGPMDASEAAGRPRPVARGRRQRIPMVRGSMPWRRPVRSDVPRIVRCDRPRPATRDCWSLGADARATWSPRRRRGTAARGASAGGR